MFDNLRSESDARGITLPATILCDGKIHRFCAENGGNKGDSGWYVGRTVGENTWVTYGDWRVSNESLATWFSGGKITKAVKAEVAKARQVAQREADKRAKEATRQAVELWEAAAAGKHAYLAQKRVAGHNSRVFEGELIIPAYSAPDNLASVQRIGDDGKRFVSGSRMSGLWSVIGNAEDAEEIYLAEGWATAATIYEATGNPVYVAFSAGNLPLVAETVRGMHPDARIIVSADNDAWVKTSDDMRDPKLNAGMIKGREAAAVCGGEFRTIPVTTDKLADGKHPTDFNDWFLLRGMDAVREALGKEPARVVTMDGKPRRHAASWKDDFLLNEDGEIKHTSLANAALVFANDPQVKDLFRFNSLSQKIYKGDAPIEEKEYVEQCVWLERTYNISVAVKSIQMILDSVAWSNAFDPVREYLDSLRWDGVERLNHMLADFLGADETAYHSVIGKRFMISAVARACRPGCKVDTVLVLEGKQGKHRKSTFVRKLFGDEFFSDAQISIKHKDASQIVCTKWCFELSELDTLERRGPEEIKGWLSRQSEHYRPPYARNIIEVPRRCVFVGTTNQADYLKDATGGRRFWPVLCRDFRHKSLAATRDQLWAEAVHLYNQGEQWWLTDEEEPEAAAMQEERFAVDTWEPAISLFVGHKDEITTADIMADCLLLAKDKWNRAAEMRVGNVLRTLGYERARRMDGGNRKYVYVKTLPERVN